MRVTEEDRVGHRPHERPPINAVLGYFAHHVALVLDGQLHAVAFFDRWSGIHNNFNGPESESQKPVL